MNQLCLYSVFIAQQRLELSEKTIETGDSFQLFPELNCENMEFKALIIFLGLINSAISEYLSVTPKVVNGTDAEISEFPFMVSLRKLDQSYCGATMLNEWWILTVIICILIDPT